MIEVSGVGAQNLNTLRTMWYKCYNNASIYNHTHSKDFKVEDVQS